MGLHLGLWGPGCYQSSSNHPVQLPVQHLGAGSLQLLQNLWQLSVIVTGGPPAQDPGQVVPGAQRKNSQLTLQQQGKTVGFSLLQQLCSAFRSVVFTCLCSVRASISDRTQPTLPSPPHTRILKVSNFWNRRRLTEEHTVGSIQPLCWSISGNLTIGFSPQVWATVHQVKHLRRVQQLLEASQELDPLIVSALGVDKHQQRAGAGRRAGRLPETFRRRQKNQLQTFISTSLNFGREHSGSCCSHHLSRCC